MTDAKDPQPEIAGPHHRDRMHRIFGVIGRASVRFRWPIVALWIVGTVLSVSLFPSLSSVVKSDNTSFLPASALSQKAQVLGGPLRQAHLTGVTVVVSTDVGSLTAAQHVSIGVIVGRLRAVAKVVAVRDLGESSDGRADQLQVLADIPRGRDAAAKALVTSIVATLGQRTASAGLQAHVAGALADDVQARKANNNGATVQLFSLIVILVLLLTIFRSVLAPFLTLIPALIVSVLAGPVLAELTKVGLQVSSLSQILLIVLVLGAGTDYGLFLVFRVREELRNGCDPHEAVARSVARVGESITFSAGTVIAALLSLELASFGFYKSLGTPLAIGIAIMLLAGLTLQPALLAIFGRKAFWPSHTRPLAVEKSGLWGRIAGRVVAAPALTLAAGLLLFGGLAIAAAGNKPIGFDSNVKAPAGTDAAAGDAVLAQHFPPSADDPTTLVFRVSKPVWETPEVLAKAGAQATESGLFNSVQSPLNPNGTVLTPARYAALHQALGSALKLPTAPPSGLNFSEADYQAYRAGAHDVSTDGLTFALQTDLRAGGSASSAAIRSIPHLRDLTTGIARDIGAVDSGVLGTAPAVSDVNTVSSGDLHTIVPVAILVIGLLLAIVMRSLVAPLYLIASVVLSYVAALGVAVLLFIDIVGDEGLTFILPFLMFIFLLALGEDYNILVMTRIREEAQTLPLRAAVARALTATGTTVTSAGLVLAGTFTVFAIAGAASGGGSQARDIGMGLALGILMDTFLVRTLLVPSTVALIGRWNWWPSRLSSREHERAVAGAELSGATASGSRTPA